MALTELRVTDLTSGISRVPDNAVYAWDRIERSPKAQEHGAFEPPEIAIEVASPGQSRRKHIERCHQFVELGTRIALMFDPRTLTIVDVRPGQPERRLRGDDVLDLNEVIPGLSIAVDELFVLLRVKRAGE
jgi:Uma2 family endonuclease